MHEDQSTEGGSVNREIRAIWVFLHNPQLLLTDERGTVQHSAYAQALAFRAAYPQIVGLYSKIAEQAAQLVPAVNGMFGRVYGGIPRRRDPEMIEAVLPQGEAVVLGTGRLSYSHRTRPTEVYVIDLETDFSAIEKRVLRLHDLKIEAVNEQMMMYALGTLAHESRFTTVKVEDFDDEATKQNGRSAKYLKHDHTKSHKRRKRK